ncbi:MAG TPA: GAF domain-containing protein, partial [Polyangia bacterium]|nr:GAF domain-containing protein [Polyangia bacterium]
MAPPLSRDRLAALVATELLRAAPEAIDETVERALGDVARHVSADRAYYYRLDADAFALAHEWYAPGLAPMRDRARFARLPVTILPEPFLATLRRGQAIALPRARGQLAAPVLDIVSPDGDRALAIVPVLLGGALLGVAGFAAAREAPWAAEDVELVEVVAQGVARAVE